MSKATGAEHNQHKPLSRFQIPRRLLFAFALVTTTLRRNRANGDGEEGKSERGAVGDLLIRQTMMKMPASVCRHQRHLDFFGTQIRSLNHHEKNFNGSANPLLLLVGHDYTRSKPNKSRR